MEMNESVGWRKMLDGFPWFNCEGCYPLTAYSEFMPSPLIGRKPLGEIDRSVFSDDDPFGWKISEIEEEYEIEPGMVHVGNQIISNIIKMGRGLPEHYIQGHGGQNLRDNPYWPPELSAKAGTLSHERFVTLLPLMLSRTQDDKGRVTWSFFGNSIHDPGMAFWKNFYTDPATEKPETEAVSFFNYILENAYGEKPSGSDSLFKNGFRILSSAESDKLSWSKKYSVDDNSLFDSVKYLLTFKPFSNLPVSVRERYLAGKLNLLPFPGSLVFWGMPGYNKLKKEFPLGAQIPLLNLVARNRGIGGFRVSQSGWIHEPHPDNKHKELNENLVKDSFHRTNRWQRVHRYQTELNEVAHTIKIVEVLFSTESDAMGLYGKPMARNSHLWTHDFDLLLDGPNATKRKITDVEKTILGGGLFGYRFFYPPMKTGEYEVYLHRPLVGFIAASNDSIEINSDHLAGWFTGYHKTDRKMEQPLELWPRILQRPLYLSALHDFNTKNDHFAHQTSFNIISILEAWQMHGMKPLSRSYAHRLLNVSKHKNFDHWFDELNLHAKTTEAAENMKQELSKILEPPSVNNIPEPVTFSSTATRKFEEAWWNEIKFLAHGQFVTKDNADIVLDEATLSIVQRKHRDLDILGDYFIQRHRKTIADAGMEGVAFCGELPFKWKTDFDLSVYGGWKGNQNGNIYERNILVVIPGKNRKEAVVFGDHYDTAYMEDIYEKGRGGSGARIAANGADDNYSASSTLIQAAQIFLQLSKEGKLERDIWLIHLTGEEFPSDCMGARNLCERLIEKNNKLRLDKDSDIDLSETSVVGVYVMDMIGHNRDNDQDIFQISPGKSAASLFLGWQAHLANRMWNEMTQSWNKDPERIHLGRGRRISENEEIPDIAKHLPLIGEVRTRYNPHSSIFNTDGQIFSDVGIPVVLFMENYDINRSGYHDTKDTMENIDLDYGSAFAAIAIETVARIATLPKLHF